MRDYEFYYTQDGSIGLYSYEDEDVYHSKYGAITEAWEKFVIPSGILDKLNNSNNINVLDVCYGIGYNTKALMSCVINNNEKIIKKNKNLEKNFFKIKNKKNKSEKYIDSIDNDNIGIEGEILSSCIDSIYSDKNFCSVSIDCLEIKKDLVKISPLLKTCITPQELEKKFPSIFDCFNFYIKLKEKISKKIFNLVLRNKQHITEILDLKYNNEFDIIKSSYKIHKLVNYIIIDKLIEIYQKDYISKELKKILTQRDFRKFFDKDLIRYATFKQNFRYNFISASNLTAFLHNIYYVNLSNRYKLLEFNNILNSFDLNFYIDDARKSIKKLNRQYDYIFLDAFTYSKAPELWTFEFFSELYNRLAPTGLIMTYSNSVQIRKTFLDNNFYVGKIIDKNTNKSIGTIAAKEKSLVQHPLNNYEIGLCNTKAGIPYHDPNLTASREFILKQREYDFKTSDLMTSSKYIRTRTTIDEGENNDEW